MIHCHRHPHKDTHPDTRHTHPVTTAHPTYVILLLRAPVVELLDPVVGLLPKTYTDTHTNIVTPPHPTYLISLLQAPVVELLDPVEML